MKYQTKKKRQDMNKTIEWFLLKRVFPVVLIFVIPAVIYGFYTAGHQVYRTWSLEHAAQDYVGSDETLQFMNVERINDYVGIAFIRYNCVSNHKILRGLKDCNGQFYIYLNRIDGEWRINEASKHAVW